MQDSSTDLSTVLQFRYDVHGRLRDHIREAIETTIDQELAAALGSSRHERTGARTGYRHGAIDRTVTTAEGLRRLTVPRGRVRQADGTTTEFQSTILPRSARRTREVDETLLGCYLGGINSRRLRTALRPLLGARHLSRSAVSRVVARLKTLWTTWDTRGLSRAVCDPVSRRLPLARSLCAARGDGPRARGARRHEHGAKQLVALRLVTAEAAASWGGLLADLQRRGLAAPLLVVTDGHAGLKKALEAWPTVRVQRSTTHKGRNLEDACPVHARRELKRDYDRIIYAASGLDAGAAYDAFVKKWTTLCAPVARSLEEAGLDLLTFY